MKPWQEPQQKHYHQKQLPLQTQIKHHLTVTHRMLCMDDTYHNIQHIPSQVILEATNSLVHYLQIKYQHNNTQ